jgi:hypothetical protein
MQQQETESDREGQPGPTPPAGRPTEDADRDEPVHSHPPDRSAPSPRDLRTPAGSTLLLVVFHYRKTPQWRSWFPPLQIEATGPSPTTMAPPRTWLSEGLPYRNLRSKGAGDHGGRREIIDHHPEQAPTGLREDAAITPSPRCGRRCRVGLVPASRPLWLRGGGR